jgi:hypothetical protein
MRFMCLAALFFLYTAAAAQQACPVSWKVKGLESHIMPDELVFPDTAESTVKEVLLDVLIDAGYAEVRLDSVYINKSKVVCHGEAGDRYSILATIYKRYEEQAPDSVVVSAKPPVSAFISAQLDALSRKVTGGTLLKQAEVSGYFFDSTSNVLSLTINASMLTIQTSRIAVSQEKEGIPVTFLGKMAGLKQGQSIGPDQLPVIRKTLQSSGYFSDVSEGRLLVKGNTMEAAFETRNLPLHTFDAVLGWVPAADGRGQLAGNAQIRARNVLTEGAQLQLRYNREKAGVTQLQLDYSAEFLAGTPFGIQTGVQFYQRDSTYLLRGFALQPFLRMNPFSRAGISLRNEASSGNRILSTGPEIPSTQSLLTGIFMDYRSVDDVFMPRNGLQLFLRAENGRKTIEATSTTAARVSSFQKMQFRVQSFHRLATRFVLTPTVFISGSRADTYTETDLERLGGAQSLRGFQENQFEGVKTAWADLEMRFMPVKDNYFFVFSGVGAFERLVTQGTKQTPEWSGILTSAGFGLADRTRIGLLKVSYAWSNQTAASGGQVHVSLRNDL